MKSVLILYGWHGSPGPHWQDWLARELVSKGYIVAFPQLSDPMHPDKEVWMREAKAAFDRIRPDIVITHSMGNTLWFHLCNAGWVSGVERLLLVAPPRDLSDCEEVKSFFPVRLPEDLGADEVLLVTSSDDPYMSEAESLQLARALNVKQHAFQNAGHLNSESGFGPWPWVLEWVMKEER